MSPRRTWPRLVSPAKMCWPAPLLRLPVASWYSVLSFEGARVMRKVWGVGVGVGMAGVTPGVGVAVGVGVGTVGEGPCVGVPGGTGVRVGVGVGVGDPTGVGMNDGGEAIGVGVGEGVATGVAVGVAVGVGVGVATGLAQARTKTSKPRNTGHRETMRMLRIYHRPDLPPQCAALWRPTVQVGPGHQAARGLSMGYPGTPAL